jgi:5-methylcytosine-specific restriction endonuclease McrA
MPSQRKEIKWHQKRQSGHYIFAFTFFPINRQKYIQCSYCGKFVNDKYLTRDHVWPKCLGGQIKTPACLSCNTIKGDMKPIDWAIFSTDVGIAFPHMR